MRRPATASLVQTTRADRHTCWLQSSCAKPTANKFPVSPASRKPKQGIVRSHAAACIPLVFCHVRAVASKKTTARSNPMSAFGCRTCQVDAMKTAPALCLCGFNSRLGYSHRCNFGAGSKWPLLRRCLRVKPEVQILSCLFRMPASGRLSVTSARKRPSLPRTPRLWSWTVIIDRS
jgi:hypothetical protein